MTCFHDWDPDTTEMYWSSRNEWFTITHCKHCNCIKMRNHKVTEAILTDDWDETK